MKTVNKILYFVLGALVLGPTAALAVQISVPSPTSNGQLLVGNGTTHNYSTTPSTGTSTIGNLGGLLNPTAFSGADIGAKTNTAYAAAPSYGAGFFVPLSTSGATWQFTTPISFSTANKPGVIHCAIGGQAANYATNGATLRYTSTTGTSTIFNIESNISAGALGIENCVLQGTNGTTARITDGVYFGGSGGAFSGYLDKVDVSGFGTGVVFRPNTSFNLINNSNIHFNGRNISEPDTSGANCENMRIMNSVIADANNQAGGATDLSGMYVQESGNCQWNMALNSFDDNQIFFDQFGGTANVNSFLGNHFENPNLHAYTMITGNVGGINNVTNMIGGDMMNDTVAGQDDQIKMAGAVNLIGFTSNSNNNVTTKVTRIVNAMASSTQINAFGLTCLGANNTSFVYGQVPCGPVVVGSDRGQPSFYVSSSTAQNPIGRVDIGTSTVTSSAVLNIGPNNLTSASSTIRMKKLQFEGENAAGATTCVFVQGTTLTAVAGACNN